MGWDIDLSENERHIPDAQDHTNARSMSDEPWQAASAGGRKHIIVHSGHASPAGCRARCVRCGWRRYRALHWRRSRAACARESGTALWLLPGDLRCVVIARSDTGRDRSDGSPAGFRRFVDVVGGVGGSETSNSRATSAALTCSRCYSSRRMDTRRSARTRRHFHIKPVAR